MKHFAQSFGETTENGWRDDDQTILSAAIVRDANELLEEVTDNGWSYEVLNDIEEAIRLLQMAKKECQ